MNWHTPALEDIETMQKCAKNNGLLANNYSAVNSFLYSSKYGSQIAVKNGWFFEKFYMNGRLFFTFPHKIEGGKPQTEEIKEALLMLKAEAELEGQNCVLRNVTLQEKEALVNIFPLAKAADAPDLGDYIYLSENLATLPGSKYSKKRNHINQFAKKHPNWHFEPLAPENLKNALLIEEKWFLQNTADGETNMEELIAEKKLISKAFENFEALAEKCGVTGGIIYAEKEPVAFCIASTLSPAITDIHFEKCIQPFAQDGGYAVINRSFAQTVATKFINREEDLGIYGLKKAKLSYYPETVLEKFNVTLD